MNAGIAPRSDLLELTPAALTALANAGFVKRAQKDLAAGLLPRIDVAADGTVAAHFDDGIITRLPPGRALRDAACNCPASGMCRHRVMLVLAYQALYQNVIQAETPGDHAGFTLAEDAKVIPNAGIDAENDRPWSPAGFDDAALAATCTPAVLAQAERLAAARPVIEVQPWRAAMQTPMARLPMCSVRFFSRSSLAHARCDCQQGAACAHVVLAVWAFREAALLDALTAPTVPDAPNRMIELAPRSASADAALAPSQPLLETEAARRIRADIDALLQALWLDGSGQPLLALTARFQHTREQAQALGWAWVDDALDELWQLLQAQHARSSRFDAQRLLRVMAELWARPRAAAHAEAGGDYAFDISAAPRASQILGVGVKGEAQLDHLRLVSLGAALWSDETTEGANVLFADPDTQTVTVLQRHWPRATNMTNTSPALTERRVAGFPLRQLAAGQVVTKAATRRANGLIDISAGARRTSVMPLSPQAWDDLAAPLKHTGIAALRATLRSALPDFVRPRQAAVGAATGVDGALHVLACADLVVLNCHWDGAAQMLRAELRAELRVEPSAESKAGIGQSSGTTKHAAEPQTLFLELPHRAATPDAVDALARTLAGAWGEVRAIAGVVWLKGSRVVMQPLALLTTQRGIVPQAEAKPEAALAAPLDFNNENDIGNEAANAGSPTEKPIADTLGLLATWLRQGLRHQSAGALARGADQIQQLRAAGLPRCADLLHSALTNRRASRQTEWLDALSRLVLLAWGAGR